jgi:hypothetical protein
MTPAQHLLPLKNFLKRATPRTDKTDTNNSVSFVSTSPRPFSKNFGVADTPPPISPANLEAIQERIEERAAIIEHEAGESREAAERIAQATMRVYRVQVAMGADLPPRWATFIAPGCDLDEATAEARGRFGPDRVLCVIAHHYHQPTRSS